MVFLKFANEINMSEGWKITSYEWQMEIADRYQSAGIPFDSIETIKTRLFTLASFLQDNGLSKRKLMEDKGQIGPGYSIHSSDLTEEGVKLIRACHTKWATKARPGDTTILKKALDKIRKT
jgi:hypothetical protein